MTADIEAARAKWKYRGETRPEFALPTRPGEESVWDYPRPPRLEQDARWVRVMWQSNVIAETRNAYRVLETASPPVFYVPPVDTDTSVLVESSGSSLCEWKGVARYWSLQHDNVQIDQVAWSYPEPFAEFVAMRDHYGFYPARVECYVDNQHVAPQPGGFYGGWVTAEVVGPFKGEPGTSSW